MVFPKHSMSHITQANIYIYIKLSDLFCPENQATHISTHSHREKCEIPGYHLQTQLEQYLDSRLKVVQAWTQIPPS